MEFLITSRLWNKVQSVQFKVCCVEPLGYRIYFFNVLVPCLVATLKNIAWIKLSGYVHREQLARLIKLFHAHQTRRSGGLHSRSASFKTSIDLHENNRNIWDCYFWPYVMGGRKSNKEQNISRRLPILRTSARKRPSEFKIKMIDCSMPIFLTQFTRLCHCYYIVIVSLCAYANIWGMDKPFRLTIHYGN